MKKIPTLFERDWTGDRSRVVNPAPKAPVFTLPRQNRL